MLLSRIFFFCNNNNIVELVINKELILRLLLPIFSKLKKKTKQKPANIAARHSCCILCMLVKMAWYPKMFSLCFQQSGYWRQRKYVSSPIRMLTALWQTKKRETKFSSILLNFLLKLEIDKHLRVYTKQISASLVQWFNCHFIPVRS